MRETLPLLWLLVNAWYRAEVRGIEQRPAKGPVLIVGNHTGGVNSPEVVHLPARASRPTSGSSGRTTSSPTAWCSTRRSAVSCAASAPSRPTRATPSMALDAGAMVTVFPGGDYEVYRPSWESAKVDFGGRKGFIRLALEAGVPIVPMVTIGGQETALFLSRGEWLARCCALDQKHEAEDAADHRSACPWGSASAASRRCIPLPAKVTIELLEPIDLRERYGEDADIDRSTTT